LADVTITNATISHALSATGTNDPAAEVQLQHWNSGHAASVVLAAAAVVGLFSNLNGMSFGTTDGAITGSYTVPAAQSVQTQPAGNIAGAGFTSTTTAGVDVKATQNSAGLSMAVPAYITTYAAQSVQTQAAGDIARSGFTTTTIAGDVVAGTLNTDGLKLAVPAYLTAAAGGGLTNIKVSAGTLSAHRSDISFNNSNGVSFGLETNGIITGSVKTDYLTTARASNDAIGLNTAKTNVTWTVNSSGLSLDAAGYAGTGTSATNASITMNSNGLAISVAAPGGGAAPTLKHHGNLGLAIMNSGIAGMTHASMSNATLMLFPLHDLAAGVIAGNLSLDRMALHMSHSYTATAISQAHTSSFSVGIYTMVNATQLSLLRSGSRSWNLTANNGNSASYNGVRWLTLGSAAFDAQPTFSQAPYWMGIWFRTSGTANNTASHGPLAVRAGVSQAMSGLIAAASSSNVSYADVHPFLGYYSASFTTAMPASIGAAQLVKTGSAWGQIVPDVRLLASDMSGAYGVF
jgi:hypothetical protein